MSRKVAQDTHSRSISVKGSKGQHVSAATDLKRRQRQRLKEIKYQHHPYAYRVRILQKNHTYRQGPGSTTDARNQKTIYILPILRYSIHEQRPKTRYNESMEAILSEPSLVNRQYRHWPPT